METVTFINSDDIKETADKLFTEQRERIVAAIPDADVQHIGSTAIPNSLTKGDVDANVRVTKEKLPSTIESLRKLYDVNQRENWNDTFASFKDDSSFELPFGVQVTVIGSPSDDFVKLRDILLQNPKLVEEYNNLKRKSDGLNMAEYRKQKYELLEKIKKL